MRAVKLATAIKELISNSTIRIKAEDLGAKIRQETGVGNAIAVIQDIMKCA
jgi:UDP:flavonoid glycosyltransferase YjiC (YdhE family)